MKMVQWTASLKRRLFVRARDRASAAGRASGVDDGRRRTLAVPRGALAGLAVLVALVAAGCDVKGGGLGDAAITGQDGGAGFAQADTGPGGSGTEGGIDTGADTGADIGSDAGGGGHPTVTTPCDGVDCGPHGACHPVAGAPACVCEAGWRRAGAGCEPKGAPADPCDGVDCGAGAQCVAKGDQPQCEANDKATCARVLEDRAALSEGTWGGAVGTCSQGTMSLDWQERTLRSVNLYRWLAGVPPLTLEPAAFQAEQACALMMHANGKLSHTPPSAWKCWTEDGAAAAGSSSIATTPAVQAVDLYVADPGNPTTLGHRRWVLSPWITTTAFGSTSGYSCMRTSGWGNTGATFVAWPPPGVYPMELHTASFATIDETGWSIQSDALSLGAASASVTVDGQAKPVTTTPLLANYGSGSALAIFPQGWGIKAGSTYTVTITGAGQPVAWTFVATSCAGR